MHPKTLKSDLPSAWDVSVHLHNETVKWLQKLKEDIMVSFDFGLMKKKKAYLLNRLPQEKCQLHLTHGLLTQQKHCF